MLPIAGIDEKEFHVILSYTYMAFRRKRLLEISCAKGAVRNDLHGNRTFDIEGLL